MANHERTKIETAETSIAAHRPSLIGALHVDRICMVKERGAAPGDAHTEQDPIPWYRTTIAKAVTAAVTALALLTSTVAAGGSLHGNAWSTLFLENATTATVTLHICGSSATVQLQAVYVDDGWVELTGTGPDGAEYCSATLTATTVFPSPKTRFDLNL